MDGHAGNYLVDLNERLENNVETTGVQKNYLGKIWSIDHSRAFYRGTNLKIKHCDLGKLNYRSVSQAFIQGMRKWQISEVEKALRASGLSEQQLSRLNLESIDGRLQRVKEHFEVEQQKRNMTDEEFYSSGIWHQVW